MPKLGYVFIRLHYFNNISYFKEQQLIILNEQLI